MSILKIRCHKLVKIRGIVYSADIDKEIEINFASAQYSVKRSDIDNDYIELIPDNMDFLHEITEIFPLSECEIKITQYLYSSIKPRVDIDILVVDKRTGKEILPVEEIIFSDTDYDCLWSVLKEAFPQYKWMTSKECVMKSIESCLLEENRGDLLTDNAIKYLLKSVCQKYDEFKIAEYNACDFDAMRDVAKQTLEEILRNGCQ